MRYPIAPWARNVIILQWEAHFVKRLLGRRQRFPAGLHLTFPQFTARTALKHPQKICSLEKIPFSVCASVKKNHSEIMIRKDLRIAQVQFLYF